MGGMGGGEGRDRGGGVMSSHTDSSISALPPRARQAAVTGDSRGLDFINIPLLDALPDASGQKFPPHGRSGEVAEGDRCSF